MAVSAHLGAMIAAAAAPAPAHCRLPPPRAARLLHPWLASTSWSPLRALPHAVYRRAASVLRGSWTPACAGAGPTPASAATSPSPSTAAAPPASTPSASPAPPAWPSASCETHCGDASSRCPAAPCSCWHQIPQRQQQRQPAAASACRAALPSHDPFCLCALLDWTLASVDQCQCRASPRRPLSPSPTQCHTPPRCPASHCLPPSALPCCSMMLLAAAAPPSPSWSASPGRPACTSPPSRCRPTAVRLTWHDTHSSWRRSWPRCWRPAALQRDRRRCHSSHSSSCRRAGSRPRRPCPQAAFLGALPGSSSGREGRAGSTSSSSNTISSSRVVPALLAGNPRDVSLSACAGGSQHAV